MVTKDFVMNEAQENNNKTLGHLRLMMFAARRHITTAETLYWVWEMTNDAIPPPPAGYESWTLEQMAQWIAENYTEASPTP